jgi:hypothetical protein
MSSAAPEQIRSIRRSDSLVLSKSRHRERASLRLPQEDLHLVADNGHVQADIGPVRHW